MSRRARYFVGFVVVAFGFFLPRILQAQSALTLEGLSERIEILFSGQEDLESRITAIETRIAPTSTPTATPTPTPEPTEVPYEVGRLSRLLALNDYEGSGQGDFLSLSENEQTQRIAFYVPLFEAAMKKCNLDSGTMFWVLNSNSNLLDDAGLSPRMETPPRAFWLTFIVENEIATTCDVFVNQATFDILDRYSD